MDGLFVYVLQHIAAQANHCVQYCKRPRLKVIQGPKHAFSAAEHQISQFISFINTQYICEILYILYYQELPKVFEECAVAGLA